MEMLRAVALFLLCSASVFSQDEFPVRRSLREPAKVQTPSRFIEPPINTPIPLTISYNVENNKEAYYVENDEEQYDENNDKEAYYVKNKKKEDYDRENDQQAYYIDNEDEKYSTDMKNNKETYYNGQEVKLNDKENNKLPHNVENNKQKYDTKNFREVLDDQNHKQQDHLEKYNEYYRGNDEQQYDEENNKQVYYEEYDEKQNYTENNKQTSYEVKILEEKVLNKSHLQQPEKYNTNSHSSNTSGSPQKTVPKRTEEIQPLVQDKQHKTENNKQSFYEQYDEKQYDISSNKQHNEKVLNINSQQAEQYGANSHNLNSSTQRALPKRIEEIRPIDQQQRSEEDIDKQAYNENQYNTETNTQRNYINKESNEKLSTRNSQQTEKHNSHNSNINRGTPKTFPKRTEEIRPVVPIVENENYVYAHSGGYHYSYESGDGTRAFEQGKSQNDDAEDVVVGGYSYKDKDGNDISLSYTAGKNGYRPVGAHLPTPPPIPPAIQRVLRILATKTTPEPVTESLNNF